MLRNTPLRMRSWGMSRNQRSITFSHDIAGKLGGYVEFVSVTGNAPGFRWQAQADIGFTYAVTGDVQFDFGCNFGLTKSAPDFQPFAGFSIRF